MNNHVTTSEGKDYVVKHIENPIKAAAFMLSQQNLLTGDIEKSIVYALKSISDLITSPNPENN